MNKKLLVLASCTFVMGYSHSFAALIPESTEEIAACESVWAEQFRDSPNYDAALQHCGTIRNCQRNSSGNRDELERCMYEAKVEFLRKTNMPEDDGSRFGSGSPTITSPAESQYSDYSDDAKGWKFSEQE